MENKELMTLPQEGAVYLLLLFWMAGRGGRMNTDGGNVAPVRRDPPGFRQT